MFFGTQCICVHCAKTKNYSAETGVNWQSVCVMANRKSGHISETFTVTFDPDLGS